MHGKNNTSSKLHVVGSFILLILYVFYQIYRYISVCMYVCIYTQGVGYCHFYQVSRISPYGHSGVLGSGHSHRSRPTVRAQGASLCYPSTSVICTLDQNLARCPRTTLGVRVVAPWLPPGQLHSTVSVDALASNMLFCDVKA